MLKTSLVTGAFLLMAACASAPIQQSNTAGDNVVSETVSLANETRPIRVIEWQDDCPVGASPDTKCGELIVPERRDIVDSRDIRVPIAIVPAPDQANKAEDPLLWLMGGTGNGFSVLQSLAILPGIVNRDVIVMEQRGNPMAKPFYGCESVPSAVLLHIWYNSSIDFTGPESVEACRNDIVASDMDLQAYTTPYAAEDLIDLRHALELETWNVYGVSYGGRVGTTLMRKDGDAIRTLTIDSAQITGTWFSAWERLKAVDAFFAKCAAATECSEQFPNLKQTFEETLAELSRNPVEITYAGQSDILDDRGYLHLVVWSLYQLGLDQTSRVPEAIISAGQGDFNSLLAINSIYGQYKPPRVPPNVGYTIEAEHNAQQISMLCAEEFPYNKDVDEPAEARAAGWGPEVVSLLEEIEKGERRICDLWGFEADDPAQAQPPVGDRPTLLIYAEHDTIAPPSHGEIALKSLDNAQLVVFPWTAHSVISERTECFMPLFATFIMAPEAPLETRCLAGIQEPDWVPMSAGRAGDNPLGLVKAHLGNTVEKFGFPARAAYVIAPDLGVDGVVAVGTSDAAQSVPLTGREVFRIASQTKVFTAATVLRLVENGQLDLDASISGLLPEDMLLALSEGGYDVEAVSVRQLLDHTAGLPDHSVDPGYGALIMADPQKRWTPLEQVRYATEQMSPVGEPGERYVYSDTGYVLLGSIVERVTGSDLPTSMRTLLDYKKLGLKATWFESLEPKPAGDLVQAEQFSSGQPISGVDPSFDLYGGGGLISTLEDQALFLRALLEGDVFDDTATLETMLSIPATNADPNTGDGYALGIWRATVDGVQCWGHSGFFGSAGYHCPDINLTMAVSRYRAEGAPGYDGAGALKSAILMHRLRSEPADPN